jgi:hypothetical protein
MFGKSVFYARKIGERFINRFPHQKMLKCHLMSALTTLGYDVARGSIIDRSP